MERQHFVHVVAYGVAWGGFPDLSRDRESTQGGIFTFEEGDELT